MWGTLLGGPYGKDFGIYVFILGPPPTWGNYHILRPQVISNYLGPNVDTKYLHGPLEGQPRMNKCGHLAGGLQNGRVWCVHAS